MNSRILTFVSLLAVACLTQALGQTPSEKTRQTKFVKRQAEWAIQKLIKPVLFAQMTQAEKNIAATVKVTVVADQNIHRVRAFRTKKGTRKVEISTGFISMNAAFFDATIVAGHFGSTDKLSGYFDEIAKYLLTYRKRKLEGKKVSMPEPFHKFAKIPEKKYLGLLRSKLYAGTFEQWLGEMLCYVLAHEYGHHVFKDVLKKPKNLAESREREDRCDDFAIRVNWAANNNPIVCVR